MWLRLPWTAFHELNAQRQSGFAPNPIAILDIVAWFELRGIVSAEDREDLYELICRLDGAWMEWARKKTDAGQQPKTRNRR